MKYPMPLVLLVVAAFLAPIMGGQVALDNLPILESGDIFKSLFGAPEAPVIAHAVLALFPCTALAMLLLKRRVIQVPNNKIGGLLLAFFALIVGTVSYSSFRYLSFPAAVEWLTYGVAFYAVIAAVGRQKGPFAMVAALAGGCTMVALLGIMEYGANKATNPTWRIFSIWINPNALAAMLLIGFCCAGALVLIRKGPEVAAWFSAALACAIAILLTQSKGGLAALAIAALTLLLLTAFWAKGSKGISLARIGGLLAAIVLLTFAIQLQSKAGAGALSRVTNASATADQSAGYRANLWKGAISMAKERPIGYGIGTYKFESGRSGLTPQTHLAHQTYLQLMAEASPVALLLFLAAAALWFFQVFRGARHMPTEQNLLRAGVIAAIIGVGAHGMIDSDLYYYGIGISTFLLLGVGLLLSVDAVAPENVPVVVRRIAASGVGVVAAMFLYFGYVDILKGQARGAAALGSATELASIANSLNSIAPGDPEGWSFQARVSRDPAKLMESLQKAADLGPTPRNYRALAKVQADAGQQVQAISTLRESLHRDPNNFLTLLQLARLQRTMGDTGDAKETLNRLVAIEKTPYYQVRALPEVIPTETADARLELAGMETDTKVKIQLVKEAVDVLKNYLKTTYPRVEQMARLSPNGNYAGESMETAQRKLMTGAQAARELAAYYRASGDEAGAVTADEDAAGFDASLATNSK